MISQIQKRANFSVNQAQRGSQLNRQQNKPAFGSIPEEGFDRLFAYLKTHHDGQSGFSHDTVTINNSPSRIMKTSIWIENMGRYGLLAQDGKIIGIDSAAIDDPARARSLFAQAIDPAKSLIQRVWTGSISSGKNVMGITQKVTRKKAKSLTTDVKSLNGTWENRPFMTAEKLKSVISGKEL